jgi:tetrahydromethanopterin S-methyltransferase subunit C
MHKSTLTMVVALAAITVFSLATSAEARGHGYGCGGGFPDIGYLPPNFSGGSHSPRAVTRAVVVHCTDHPYVVWRHCDVNRCR